MNIKRTIALFVSFAAVFALAACGGAQVPETAPEASPPETQAVSDAVESPAAAVPDNAAEAWVRSSGEAAVWVEGGGYPLKIRDYEGYEFELTEKPERVAVISAATLNIWYDAGGKSVATPEVSDNVKLDPLYEQEIRALPSLGMYYAMSLETLVELQADLYIMNNELRAMAAKSNRQTAARGQKRCNPLSDRQIAVRQARQQHCGRPGADTRTQKRGCEHLFL